MSTISLRDFEKEVLEAFASFWRTGAGFTTVPQIADPNGVFDRSKAGGPFIEWLIQGSPDGETRYSHSVEPNHFARRGTIVFTANVPVRSGDGFAFDMLDQVDYWLTAVSLPNGIFTGVGTPLSLGDDGSFHQVSLSANWLYFTDRPTLLP